MNKRFTWSRLLLLVIGVSLFFEGIKILIEFKKFSSYGVGISEALTLSTLGVVMCILFWKNKYIRTGLFLILLPTGSFAYHAFGWKYFFVFLLTLLVMYLLLKSPSSKKTRVL